VDQGDEPRPLRRRLTFCSGARHSVALILFVFRTASVPLAQIS
jgi:hypothetical protein